MSSQDNTVPESDLLALKAKLEKETGELQAQIVSIQSKADTHYSSLLAEQAAKETIAAELENLKKEVELLRPIKGLKEQTDAQVKELQKRLLDVSTSRLVQVYKIPEDKLKNKTLAELNAIEEALRLVGREPGRFDISGVGVGAGAEKLTAQEKIRLGFEQLRK